MLLELCDPIGEKRTGWNEGRGGVGDDEDEDGRDAEVAAGDAEALVEGYCGVVDKISFERRNNGDVSPFRVASDEDEVGCVMLEAVGISTRDHWMGDDGTSTRVRWRGFQVIAQKSSNPSHRVIPMQGVSLSPSGLNLILHLLILHHSPLVHGEELNLSMFLLLTLSSTHVRHAYRIDTPSLGSTRTKDQK